MPHECIKKRGRISGQSLVEFAIILTIVLLLILGSIDLGRGLYAFSVIQNAAREGARYGSVNPSDTSGIFQATRNLAHGLDTSVMNISPNLINLDADADIDMVRVVITYTFHPVTPLLGDLMGGSGSITMTSSAQMMVE